jgi:hypothetical protein
MIRRPDLRCPDVDDILRQALLQAIKAQLSTMPQSSFPIPASTFYSTYILPSRPSSSPSSADIKKSSYKKLAKFLQVFEKQGILRLKDSKGDVVVTGVSATHVDVVAHRPFKTIGAVEASEVKAAKAAVAEAAKVRPMEISELYKPHGQSVQFFEMLRKSYAFLDPLFRFCLHAPSLHQREGALFTWRAQDYPKRLHIIELACSSTRTSIYHS